MTRRNWKKVNPRSLRESIESCKDYAVSKGRSVERKPMGLVEFAEVCMGGKVADYQRTLLDAIERGEKLRICQTTGRPYFDEICRNWRAHVDLMRANAAVGALLGFAAGRLDAEQVGAELNTALEALAWHRENVNKVSQPELEFGND